ncbi:hypothetical protein HDE_10399 [Halotydeus destructor]|nr:hypothetical protein HDE_10399 [Halotydeus destructor]
MNKFTFSIVSLNLIAYLAISAAYPLILAIKEEKLNEDEANPEEPEVDDGSNPVPGFFVLLITIIMVGLIAFAMMRKSDSTKGQPFIVSIATEQKRPPFSYWIQLRLGCPTDNFDYENCLINFEWFDGQNNTIFQHKTPGKVFSETEMTIVDVIMNRNFALTPKNLDKIQFYIASNSGEAIDYSVFFFGIDIFNRKSREREIVYTIDKYMKGEKTTSRLTKRKNDQSSNSTPTEKPQVPIPQLNLAETFVTVYAIISIIAIICLYFPHQEKHSIDEAIMSTAFGLTIGLIAQFIFIVSYRLIKHEDVKQRLVLGVDSVYEYGRLFFMVFLFVLGLIVASMVFVTSNLQENRDVYYWLAATIDASSLTIGVWAFCATGEAWPWFVDTVLKRKKVKASQDQSLSTSVGSQLETAPNGSGISLPNTASQISLGFSDPQTLPMDFKGKNSPNSEKSVEIANSKTPLR